MIKELKKSILAGVMICIGSTVYLLCESKIIAAFLFAVGLFSICTFEMNLFTGKIAYIFDKFDKSNCFVIWIGNLIGCMLAGLPIKLAIPEITQKAYLLVENKLQSDLITTIILSIFCGILMYLAVENYRISKNELAKVLGLFLNVAVFIICGFEHSIANMCYCIFSVNNYDMLMASFIFIIIVSFANGIGAILCRKLTKMI